MVVPLQAYVLWRHQQVVTYPTAPPMRSCVLAMNAVMFPVMNIHAVVEWLCFLCAFPVLHVQGIVPREAAVHVLMGRLYKRLRNPDAALTAFNIGEWGADVCSDSDEAAVVVPSGQQ